MPRNKKNKGPMASFAIEGHITAETRKADTGELVDRIETTNRVVNNGLDQIMRLVGAVSGAENIEAGGIGTGGGTEASGNTSLTAAVFDATSFTSATTAAASNSNIALLRYTWSYATDDTPNNVSYQEVGLCRNTSATFAANALAPGSDNILFTRATHTAIAKTTDVTLSYTYDLKFQSAS